MESMLRISQGRYNDVIDHARSARPEECCGILGGTFDSHRSEVSSAYRANNAAARPETRYYIDPVEQLELIERIEADGDEVVGFYHSHPMGPLQPSQTDAARATWPGLSYVIISLSNDPLVGSWRWHPDAGFEEERIVIRSGDQSDASSSG